MNDRILFLHIGTEKTGTTTLQAFLHHNARRLSELSFWYPNDQETSYFQHRAHFPIAGSLLSYEPDFVSPKKHLRRRDAVPDFLRDARECATSRAILSCEHFSSRVHEISTLAEFRNELSTVFDTIKIVCYIRAQPDLALSAYSSNVQGGRRERLSPDEVNPDNAYYNFVSMLDLWTSVFGHENLIVREFDREKLTNGDICCDFCNVLDIPFETLERVNDENRAIGASKLEMIRQLNRYFPTYQEDVEGWRAAERLRKIITAHIDARDDPEMKLGRRERLLILEKFRQHNEILNRKYMQGTLSESWFFALSYDSEDESLSIKNNNEDSEGNINQEYLFDTIIELAKTIDKEPINAEYEKNNAQFELPKYLSHIEKYVRRITRSKSAWL